jgi:hypothetical integral membrane protein (TIGR02206 family)
MEHEFARFDHLHLLTLCGLALLGAACVALARRGSLRVTRGLRLGLGFSMLGGALAEVVWGLSTGQEGLQEVLPLQLCDCCLLMGALGLLTCSRWLVTPLYFFALSGTLPALLMPELPGQLTSLRLAFYFGLHGLTVIALLTLVAGLRVRPLPGGWWMALLWLNVLAVVVGSLDAVFGWNFMYLRAKPVVSSPFDWLGPWPWYIVSLEFVCGAVFWVMERVLTTYPHQPTVTPCVRR